MLTAAVLLALAACVRVDESGKNTARQRALAAAQIANPTAAAAAAIPTGDAVRSHRDAVRSHDRYSERRGHAPRTRPSCCSPAAPRRTTESSATEGDGGRNNIVNMVNRKDGRLRFKGRVQLNRIASSTVNPLNQAIAYASCTDCQTYAVALQLNVIGRNVTNFQPQNVAVAVNYRCTRCHTVARAVQNVRQVDDPHDTPDDVRDQMERLDRELKKIHAESDRLTTAEVDRRIDAVVARFTSMAQGTFSDRRDDAERDNSRDKVHR